MRFYSAIIKQNGANNLNTSAMHKKIEREEWYRRKLMQRVLHNHRYELKTPKTDSGQIVRRKPPMIRPTFAYRKGQICVKPVWKALPDHLEIERGKPLAIRTMNGFGDLCWLMTVINNFKKYYELPKLTIRIQLAGDHRDGRATNFIARFKNVDEVGEVRYSIHRHPISIEGKINYTPSGYNKDKSELTLIINPYIEWVGRIENIFPDVPCDWDVLNSGYQPDPEGVKIAESMLKYGKLNGLNKKGYICWHFGCLMTNTSDGMNRGETWNLSHWYELGIRIREISDLPIYILGARYDNDYATKFMSLYGDKLPDIYNLCGATNATQVIEVLRQANLVVSFASGLPIASTYMYVPTIMFWMPQGYSVSSTNNIQFSDAFATNWVPQKSLDSKLYYPAFYHRDTVDSVFEAVLKMTK